MKESHLNLMGLAISLMKRKYCGVAIEWIFAEAVENGLQSSTIMVTAAPASAFLEHLNHVVRAVVPFMDAETGAWHWEIYTADGLVKCWSDGRQMDADGKPIDYTDFFVAYPDSMQWGRS